MQEREINEKYIDYFKLTKKKGNSQILCEQFKKGAEAKGHQAKIVHIMEQNIGFCRACDGCMRNGGIIDGESSSEFAYCLAWSISIRKETGI